MKYRSFLDQYVARILIAQKPLNFVLKYKQELRGFYGTH